MRNSSRAASTCPSGPTRLAVSTSSMIRLIGGVGSTPSLPFEFDPRREQRAQREDGRIARVHLRIAGEGKARRVLVPDFAHELVGVAHAEMQGALANLHDRLHADRF